ncbi:Sip1-related alpha-galactosidase [Listeria costaricensis]|uniref:Sip1-related alpha-galactosidase n=1 Tax=Listeria costaricensis TaxID=2026604 RepID=UPI000C06FBAD|nr:Sip1-related alpha-galactosidase [Listeria costaricensis]
MEINQIHLQLDDGSEVYLKQAECRAENEKITFIFDTTNVEQVAFCQVVVTKTDDFFGIHYDCQLSNTSCRANYGFAREAAITFQLAFLEKSLRFLSLSHFNYWWTRPYFCADSQEIPADTVTVFAQKERGHQLLTAVSGEKSKTVLRGAENGLLAQVTPNFTGYERLSDWLLFGGSGDDFYQLSASVFDKARAELGCATQTRPNVSTFGYLGWCSWDAFYKEVSEAGILAKAAEFQEKKIPVKWMLIDDGWLLTEREELLQLEEDRVKFPRGFAPLIADLKQNYGVEQVGVWHTLAGYWGGISKQLFQNEPAGLVATPRGKHVPDPSWEKGLQFWDKWYRYLRQQGIDFVKTDGQSALQNHYREAQAIGQVAHGVHKAHETAAALHFDSAVIHCMGMAVENFWHHQKNGIIRTSDDFLPTEHAGFTEHLLQNVYNSLTYANDFQPDWDMFWSEQFDAKRHAVLRVMSGGPIYISDKLDASSTAIIRPLVYQDGQLVRCDRPGRPTVDHLYQDPTEGVIKLVSTVGDTQIVAVFNLTDQTCKHTLPDNPQQVLAYEYFEQKASIWPIAGQTIELNPYEVKLYTLLEQGKTATPIGLAEKYLPSHAITSLREEANGLTITLKESGDFVFYAETEPVEIKINGKAANRAREMAPHQYMLSLPATAGQTEIQLNF